MANALDALREQYPEYYDMFLAENNIGQAELDAMSAESGQELLANFTANLQQYAARKESENSYAETVLTNVAEAEVIRNFDDEAEVAPEPENATTARQSEAAEDPFYWDSFARPNDEEIAKRLNEIGKMQQTEEFKDYTFSSEYTKNNSKISDDFNDIINYGAARNLAAKSDTAISPLAFNNERRLEKERIETEYYTALHQLSQSADNKHRFGFYDMLYTVSSINTKVYLEFDEKEIIDYLDTANTLARNMGVAANSPQVADGLKSLRRAARRSVIASNAGMMRRWYDKPIIAKSFHYAGKFVDSLQKIESSNAFVASLANLKLSGNPVFIAYRSILSTRAIYNDVKNFQDYAAFKNAFTTDEIEAMGWRRYQSIEGAPELDQYSYNQLLTCKNYAEYQKIAGEYATLSAEQFRKIHKLQAQTEFNRTDFDTVKQFALKSSYDEYRGNLKGNSVDEQTFNHIRQYALICRTFDYGEYQKAAKELALSVDDYHQIRAATAPARLPVWRAIGAAVANKQTRKEIIAHSGYFIRSLPFIGQAYGLCGMAKNLVSIRAYKSLGTSFKAVKTSVKNLYSKKGRSREDWKNLWVNANGLLATGYGFVMAEQSLTSAYNGAVANIHEMQNSDVSAGEHILNTISAQWNDYKAKWAVNLFGKDVNAAVHNMNANQPAENISQLDDVAAQPDVSRENGVNADLSDSNEAAEQGKTADETAPTTEPASENTPAAEKTAEVKVEETKVETKTEQTKAETQEKETAAETKAEETKVETKPEVNKAEIMVEEAKSPAESATKTENTPAQSQASANGQPASASEILMAQETEQAAQTEASVHPEDITVQADTPAQENQAVATNETTTTNEAAPIAVDPAEINYTITLDGDRSIAFSFDDNGNIILAPQAGDGAALADFNEDEARAAILQQMAQLQSSGQELSQGAAAFLAANNMEMTTTINETITSGNISVEGNNEIKISENNGEYSMTVGDGKSISFHFARGSDRHWHMMLTPEHSSDLANVDNEAAAKAVYEHFKDEDNLPRPLRKFMADYEELHSAEQSASAENANNAAANDDNLRSDEIVSRSRISDSYFVTGRYTVAENGEITFQPGYACQTDHSVLDAIRESNGGNLQDGLSSLNGYIHSDNFNDCRMQEEEMARRITLTYAAVHDIEAKVLAGQTITAGEQLAVNRFNGMLQDMGLSVDDKGQWHWQAEPETGLTAEQSQQSEAQTMVAEPVAAPQTSAGNININGLDIAFKIDENGNISNNANWLSVRAEDSILAAIHDSAMKEPGMSFGNGHFVDCNYADHRVHQEQVAADLTIRRSVVNILENRAICGEPLNEAEMKCIDNFYDDAAALGLSGVSGQCTYTGENTQAYVSRYGYAANTTAREDAATDETAAVNAPASTDNQATNQNQATSEKEVNNAPKEEKKNENTTAEPAVAAELPEGTHQLRNMYFKGSYYLTENENGFDMKIEGTVHASPAISAQLRDALNENYAKTGKYQVGKVTYDNYNGAMLAVYSESVNLTKMNAIAADIAARQQESGELSPAEQKFLEYAQNTNETHLPGYKTVQNTGSDRFNPASWQMQRRVRTND